MQRKKCGQCGRDNSEVARYCGHCGVLLVRIIPELAPPPVPPAPLRSGEQIGVGGRYRIDRPLGGGNFSQVFLAEDTRLNRLCAIKQLRIDPSWPPETVRQVMASFSRESLLLASLTTPGHRHIPDVYDHLDDRLCLVMKHVAGEDLAALMARRATPLPEEEALRYARDACAALTYMHDRLPPVLHRDLKPANMIRDSSGNIVLIDFGLASPTLTGGPLALAQAGTPGYMPPEQWRGVPEPRSDVYALGATLYRMLAGRTPPSPDADPAPPICQINPAVRPEVDALVRRALAAAPVDRPSSAEFLAGLEDLLARRVLPPPEPEHPLAQVDLVGRVAELSELTARLANGRAVVLAGMPGAGKTAIAVTMAKRHPDPARVFWHTFRDGEGVDVLIGRLAAWLAHSGSPEAWQRLQSARQSGGQPLVPELFAGYLVQLMRGCEGLLCLDDLHAAADDPALLRVVGLLIDASHAGGPALLATARAVPKMTRFAVTVALGGLSESEAVALFERSGIVLAPGQALALARATEGNPRFLTLAITALGSGVDPASLLGQLRKSKDLANYLMREVDSSLTIVERKVMEAVSALQGYGGSQDVIAALTDGQSDWRTLDSLAERYLLSVEPRADGETYRQHAIVQGFYYGKLTPRLRQPLHERAGEHYEAEGDMLAAARHFALAGRPERVAAALTRDIWGVINAGHAGEARALLDTPALAKLELALQAEARTALGEICVILGEYDTARGLLDRALDDSPAQSVQQARRHRLLAQVYARIGDYAQAEQHCRRGLALADTGGPVRTETARLYTQLAEVLMRRSAFEEAERACDAGLFVLPPAPANPAERGALLFRRASIVGRRGAYEEAIRALKRSLDLARQAADSILTATVLHNLGVYYQSIDQIEQAVACYNESLHLARQVGNLVVRLATTNCLGVIHLDRGELSEALAYFEESRALSEQFNLADQLAIALINIGGVHYEQGDLESAAAQLERARATFSRLGVLDEEARCLYRLGDVALRRGDAVAAERYGQQAAVLAHQIGSEVYISCALRVCGEARLALGDLQAATGDLDRAWQLQQESGDPYDEVLLRAALAALALAQGERVRARSHARAALAFARERGLTYLEFRLESLLARLVES